MKCLINGTGIEEGLYPLTSEMPAGLLSVRKNGRAGKDTILDRVIGEMEADGQTGEYLVVTCEKYAEAYEVWKEGHALKDKICLARAGENMESAALIQEFVQDKEDWLVLPHNAAFSIQYMIEAWRERMFDTGCAVYCGNEADSYPLPIFFLKEGIYPENMGKLFLYRPEKLIKSLPEYERLTAEAGGPGRYREFSVQAYTQERYGKYFISNIHMENTILMGGEAFAYIRIHNGSDAALVPEHVRVGYHLWLEQTYENSFQIDKIPVTQKEPAALPVEIRPGSRGNFRCGWKGLLFTENIIYSLI